MHIGQPPQPTKLRKLPKWVFAIFAVLILAALGGIMTAAYFAPRVIGALKGGPDTFSITGELTITGSGIKYGASSADCVGDGGYGDIRPGLSVVVTDSKGETVAVGSIPEEGKARRESVSPIRPTSCTFAFSVAGVPEGSKFYGVTIGRRGTQQYSREELGQPIRLTLS